MHRIIFPRDRDTISRRLFIAAIVFISLSTTARARPAEQGQTYVVGSNTSHIADTLEFRVHIVPIDIGKTGSSETQSILYRLLDTNNANLRKRHMRAVGVIVRSPKSGGMIEVLPHGWIAVGPDSAVIPIDPARVRVINTHRLIIAGSGVRDTVTPIAVVMIAADSQNDLTMSGVQRESILHNAFPAPQATSDAMVPIRLPANESWKDFVGSYSSDPGNTGAHTYYISVKIPLRLFKP